MKIRNILIVVLSLFTLQGCTLGGAFGEKKTGKVSMFKGVSATQSKQNQVKLKTTKPVSNGVRKSTFARSNYKKSPVSTANRGALVQYKKMSSIEKECLEKYYVGYEYALCLYENKEFKIASDYLKRLNRNGLGNKLTVDLAEKIKSPFAYIVRQANLDLADWISRKTELPEFEMQKPTKVRNTFRAESLVKDEFETTENFNNRVASAQQEVDTRDQLLEIQYQEKLNSYNQALEAHNEALKQEAEKRQARSEEIYLDYINKYIDTALGFPFVEDSLYDADTQTMYLSLASNKSDFNQVISINASLEDARGLSENIVKMIPILEFDISRKKMSINQVKIELADITLETNLVDGKLPKRKVVKKVVKSKSSK